MAIDYALTPRQRELRRETRAFANEHLAGVRASAEALPTAEQRFLATKPAYEAMVAAGHLRKCIPISAGGESAGLVDVAILTEELYSVNASVTLTLLGTALGLAPLLIAGTADQRARWLPPFLERSGAPLVAFCLSEPGGSANAASPPPGEGVRTTAKLRDDVWVIEGRKKWVSSATGWDRKGADLLCVLCRTDFKANAEAATSIIAVPRPARGLVFERAIEAVGHRAHLTPEFRFENVEAPRGHLIGEEGRGLAVSAASFTGFSAIVGFMGVALMRAAFEFTLRFARTERRAGVSPIIEHQAVGYALADAKMSMEAARSLCWRACQAVDAGSGAADELAIQAKIYGSETAVRVITALMEVVGVDSYDSELPLGPLLADALALPVFGGGNMGVRRRQLHAMLKRPDYDPRPA